MKKLFLLTTLLVLLNCSSSEVKEQEAPIEEVSKTPEEIVKEKQEEDIKKGTEKLPVRKK